jgi:hypothetical protein
MISIQKPKRVMNSDAGELHRRKHTTFRTWQKFEIKNGRLLLTFWDYLLVPSSRVKQFLTLEDMNDTLL